MSNPIDLDQVDPKKLYTLKDVGRILDLGYTSVLKLKKEEVFKKGLSKIGNRYYVLGQSIINYTKITE